jgi:hypothetical protein
MPQQQADALALIAETALHHGIDPGASGERYQVASSKSVPEREPFRRRCGARCTIAIADAASRAVGYGSAKVITSATGLTEARRRFRTSRCYVGGTTGPSTRTVIRWSAGRTAS